MNRQLDLQLGSTMLHSGRAYVLRGFSRQSHKGAQFVHLEDKKTGDWIDVTWAELSGEDAEEPSPVN